MEDIAPQLLEAIRAVFVAKSGELAVTEQTWKAAEQYAYQVGSALAEAFGAELTSAALPDGKLYWNIADRVVRPLLEEDHQLVSDVAAQVQQALNEAAGIGLKAQTVPVNRERIDGILNKLCEALRYDDVAWVLGEPVINFSQSVVDETIQANVDFQGKAGLQPRVVRTVVGGCCKWCRSLAGTCSYPNVPQDVYRRHERCRCRVEYDPGSGRRQNVHTKQWTEDAEPDKIALRKQVGMDAH
ncbi:MAG: hypothetical protein ACI3U8_02165 [Candidatus Onthomonas sp.]